MKKVTIKNLEIYSPSINQNTESYTKDYNDDFDINNYLHFTIILNDDSSIWKYGSLYLLSKLKTFKKPEPKTLESIAYDLIDFINFCKKDEINYLSAERRILRPTYLYRNNLEKRLRNGLISLSVIRRRMGSVVGFYQYLIETENIFFKYPLWEKSMTTISFHNEHGFKKHKQVESKDVSRVIQRKNSTLTSNRIADGGTLKPLKKEEQQVLFDALYKIGNTEMTLSMLLSVVTGARIQTVFTLRLKQFMETVEHNVKEIDVNVGIGTLVDTKYGKPFVLKIPTWVYNKIKVYLDSERYKKRLDNAKHIFSNIEESYVFLTNRGIPYYAAKNDSYRKLYKEPQNGNSVRQFISSTLSKYLYIDEKPFDFSFHDLRATFGMNLLEELLELVDQKKIKLSFALMYVKDRMNHSSINTTERYLKFREANKVRNYVQNEFEIYLIGLLADDK